MKLFVTLAVLFPILTAAPALAWNSPGHQIIGLIAYYELPDEAQANVYALLRTHPRFEQHFVGKMPREAWNGNETEKRAWAFGHAGTWPDLVRQPTDGISRDDVLRFNRPQWHYINLPIFLTDEDKTVLSPGLKVNRASQPPENPDAFEMNILQAIQNSQRIVLDVEAPVADRAVHLCWLFHLVGDSHQPCHSTALFTRERFPEGDRGGNDIKLTGRRNLHSYWDGAIMERGQFNDFRGVAVDLRSKQGSVGLAAAKELTPKKWLLESYKLARQSVYTQSIRDDVEAAEQLGGKLESPSLERDYHIAASKLARTQAVRAGYRLAAILATLPTTPIIENSGELFPQPMARPTPPRPPPTVEADTSSTTAKRYWLNTSSNVRHNESCKWFGKTKRGYYCEADEGKACGQCKG